MIDDREWNTMGSSPQGPAPSTYTMSTLMKLSKKQALDLVKILTHYQTLVPDGDIADVHGLRCNLEERVLNGDEDEEEIDDEEDKEDDGTDKEDSGEKDDEEPGEAEDEEDEEVDDGGPEDEEKLDVDSYARSRDLHDLKPAKAKIIGSSTGDPDDEVILEFEHTGGDDVNICDLLVNGEPIGPITYVRRKGNELHIAENNRGKRVWHRFHVSRYPKGWADVLPLDDLVEVK